MRYTGKQAIDMKTASSNIKIRLKNEKEKGKEMIEALKKNA